MFIIYLEILYLLIMGMKKEHGQFKRIELKCESLDLKRGLRAPFLLNYTDRNGHRVEYIPNLNCPYLQEISQMIIQVSIFRNINFPM